MKTKIIILFAFLLILTGFTFPSCGKDEATTPLAEETTPTPESTLLNEPLLTIDPLTYDAKFTANYESAYNEAKKWQPDAQLVMVSVKLPMSLALDSATQTYTFGSANETNYWWTYSYSEATQKYVRALVNKDDYLGVDIKPIPLKFWRTNYLEAFQIADNYQGRDFRLNNANTEVTLTLKISDPNGWLWWIIEYKSALGQNLSFRVNPNDRSLADESGNIITTAQVYTPEETVSPTTTAPTTQETTIIE